MASQPKTTGCTARKRANSPSQPSGQWIRADARLAIYLRDHMTCLYCTKDLHDADPRDITLDHIVPKCDGGSNRPENLVTACRACNCRRKDRPLNRFASKEAIAHIRRNVRRSMAKYRKLAKALISGETGFEATLESL